MSSSTADNIDIDYNTETVSVLVIGAGAAGARAGIELKEQGIDDVLVVSRHSLRDAHTKWARGGINAALGNLNDSDSWSIHAADTLKEGHFVNDPEKVEIVAENIPDRVREVDEWGMPFTRTDNEKINQRYFGAQAYPRTVFAGDHTGESLLNTLIDKAQELNVPYRDGIFVTKIISDGDTAYGAVGVNSESGRPVVFNAGSVVLAAGGYSAIYGRHSSTDDENTGDGPALALEGGAEVMDMEFVQFHPTGMAVDESDDEWASYSGRLVTEAVRGEGGHLYNTEGERFMERYSPEQKELDARDVVARSIRQEIDAGRGTENGGVYLDISHKDREFIEERLPRMYERFQSLGVDMAEEPVEVAPTSHYGMGGVVTDKNGETCVSNLYAIGETMAGVHGANRLGGNSLAETVVYGKHTGEHIANEPTRGETTIPDVVTEEVVHAHIAHLTEYAHQDGDRDPETVLNEVRDVMWDVAGVYRSEEKLTHGKERLAELREEYASVETNGFTSESFAFAQMLRFALITAETIINGALEREESRGAHYRTDYEDTDEEYTVNLHQKQTDEGYTVTRHTPQHPSEEVQKALDEGHELDYHQLE